MPISHDMGEVGRVIYNMVNDMKDSLGLAAVYFGDTDLKPTYPAVAVQSLGLRREIKGTHKFKILMEHELVMTVFKMGDPQGREDDIHTLIGQIVDVLNNDRSLRDSVIFSMVTEVDMVDVALGSVMVRGATITVQSLSEEVF
jgi:hypothetical protein